MNSKPKILVFRMREMIYTLLLIVFAVLLIICLFLMFSGRTSTETPGTATSAADTQNAGTQQTDASRLQSTDQQQTSAALQAASAPVAAENTFTPGIYTVPLYLSGASVEVEVTVDADHINSIRLVNLSESVEAMYPLMTPSLNHIATQILQKQSLDEITSPQENRYTSQMLLNAISDALELAQ